MKTPLTIDPGDLPATTPVVAAAAASEDACRLRLAHLFRHTLKSAQVNPLLLMLPTYRDEVKT